MIKLLKSLPALIAFILELRAIFKAIMRAMKEKRLQEYLEESTKTVKDLQNAKTTNEKRAVAERIGDLFGVQKRP